MKIVLFLFCFACLIYCTFAAVAREPANKDKNHPGHCYTKMHNLGPFRKGEQKYIPGKCETAVCLDNGDIEYETCGAVGVVPPCRLTERDLSKPYPDCCPQPRCP